MDKAVAEVRAD